MKRVSVVFLMFCFLVSFGYSQNYADIEIDIFKDGLLAVSGTTNYEEFEDLQRSSKYTSKDGEYWVFNLTTDEVFEEYVFKINLPANSAINYIKAPKDFRIENNEGQISIVGFAENQPMNLVVQYKIDYFVSYLSKDVIILFLSGSLVFMFVFVVVLMIKLSDLKKRKELGSSVEKVKKNDYDIEMFTPRQKEIISLLEKRKKVTQKELEESMNIPKSSVSRNVRTLEIKDVIVKERVGQTNYLFLKKSL